MRPATVAAAAYVVAVAVLATWGFAAGTTVLILLAFALALPTGAAALVGYYVAYGLLAQVVEVDPVTAGVLGVLAATAAAVVDAVLLRLLLRRQRGLPVDDDSRPGVPAC